ncbi:hypothetical protein P3526_25405, partial [Vibrio parahaemolyticus]|nr:hypothetical protein [Vibrio parahaemolyticus]
MDTKDGDNLKELIFHYVDSYIVFVLSLLLLWYSHKTEKKRVRIILFITALIVVTPHVTIWSNFIFML